MNLRELARFGAHTRLIEMQDETKAILKEFPDLKEARGAMSAKPKARRHGMSAAARKAVSVRMKRYWKNKRK